MVALSADSITARYRVTGMDCPSCASKIESATRTMAGVEDVKVSIASQIMTLRLAEAAPVADIERKVTGLGYQLKRLDAPLRTGAGAADDDELSKDRRNIPPGYKRALWLVVVLNIGYGVIEIGGGILAGSQALQADALDFLGDGLITLLGLLAIAWPLAWRARAALLQGLFLGALGLGVLTVTGYRVLVLHQPTAELMGVLGAVALAINVCAALVLVPHRHGDANVRAVWLFSRNDALGNLAVVAAAGLVWWTGSPWPDLAVGLAIAVLFLQSAWSIVRDARRELRAHVSSRVGSLSRTIPVSATTATPR